MSFSSLPTELVRQIIESSVPSTFHSTTYKERQSTLRSLSLVSRRLREIAQPLLYEIVWIQTRNHLEATARSSHRINQLVYEVRGGDDFGDTSFPRAVARSVTKFVLCWRRPGDIAPLLREFTHLVDLHLSIDWSFFKAPFFFPALRSLTIANISPSAMIALVQVETVPKLRTFALVDDQEDSARSLLQTGIAHLLPQLDALSLDIGVWRHLEAGFRSRASAKTLVDASYRSLQTVFDDKLQVLNLRIYTTSADYDDPEGLSDISDALANGTDTIERKTSSALVSLYLGHKLGSFRQHSSELNNTVKHLLEVCKLKHVDVIWEESPSHFEVDPVISSIFWRN